MQRLGLQLVVACAIASVAADPAVRAAEQPSRIFRGLFGPDPDAAVTSHPVVELRVATYEARGQTQRRAGEGVDESTQDDEFYSGVTTGVSYRRKARTALLTGSVGNALRVYPLGGVTVAEHSGYGGIEVRPNRRTTVRGAGGVLYTPLHQVLGLAVPTDGGGGSGGDASLPTNASTTYSGGLSVARQIGRRGVLTVGGDGRTTQFAGRDAGTTAQQAGATYTYDMGKGFGLRVGDGVRVLRAGTAPPIVAQDIALGIDVNRALTESRRTTVTVTTGSSIASSETGRRLIATGAATLLHRVGRSWQASASIERGLQVADLLPEPFVANNASFTVGGFLSRRASLRVRGAYGFGDFDLDGSASPYRSYLAEGRAGIALGRHVQLYIEHLYYQHRFPEALLLPADVPHRRVQHGTRFGLDIWATLMGRS